MEDVRAAWKDGLLVLVVWVAAMLVARAVRSPAPEAEPPPEHATDHMMGGPGWRVVDVREVPPEEMPAVDSIVDEVAACLGVDPAPLDRARWFGVTGIMYRNVNVTTGSWQWRAANGLTMRDSLWIYVRSASGRRTADHVVGTVKHEVVHVLTDLGHPAADRLIGKCAGMHAGQARYRRD